MPDRLLAQDIVTMSREPLLVLDEQLTVIAASRSFYGTFGASQNETVGLPIARIANGLFDTPLLTQQLRRVDSGQAMLENFEIRQDAVSGARTFLLHASAIRRDGGRGRGLMLTVEDVTERRRIEADCEEAIMSANNMLVELNHRIMNSFAMIGAIVTMEGRTQQDDNCRAAFDRMRSRITSIAHLYRNLGRSTAPEAVHADEYLKNIVSDLVTSLSHPERKIDVAVSIVQDAAANADRRPAGADRQRGRHQQPETCLRWSGARDDQRRTHAGERASRAADFRQWPRDRRDGPQRVRAWDSGCSRHLRGSCGERPSSRPAPAERR